MNNEIWNSSFYLDTKKLKNRIVFPPITLNWATDEGFVAEKNINFYKKLAEGGCGMIVIEGTAISQEGKATSNSLCLFDKNHLNGFKELVKEIKKNNCFASLQISHAGGQANPNFTKQEPISPSGLECKATGFKSRQMNEKDIEIIKQKFVKSADLAYEAGFDAVELHLAHGYLLHQFLSEYTNKRNDSYGGNLENRMRIVLEILEEIKKQTPIIIGTRISGEDYIKDGINNKINEKMLPIFKNAGIKYFSLTAGIYETSKNKHEAMKKGEFFNYSKETKEIVSVPVIGVGKVLDLETAEKHLQNKDCDLVAIGRGLIADPDMIKKYQNGESYNRCIECNECQYLRFGRKDLSCKLRDF